MTLLTRLRSWCRASLRPAHMESDMDAELRAHIESHAEYLIATGVPAEEAQRRATLEFGPVGQAKEDCRDAGGANLIPRCCRI